MTAESIIKPHPYTAGPLANGKPICRWCTASPDHPAHVAAAEAGPFGLHDGPMGEPNDHRAGERLETCQTCFEALPGREQHPAGRQGHNGWVNRDTWAVNLWLSNEERSYHAARAIATAPASMTDRDRIRELRRLARFAVGDRYSAGRVDWGAILEAFREE